MLTAKPPQIKLTTEHQPASPISTSEVLTEALIWLESDMWAMCATDPCGIKLTIVRLSPRQKNQGNRIVGHDELAV